MDGATGFGYGGGRGRGRGDFGRRVARGHRGRWRDNSYNTYNSARDGPAYSNSDRREERVVRPMEHHRLRGLCEKDPQEVLLTLVAGTSGCKELLEETTISDDQVALLLRVLARACDCSSSPANTVKLMVMLRDSEFLTRTLQTYFAKLPAVNVHRQEFREPMKHALRLFRELLDRNPSSVTQVYGPLAVLGTAVSRFADQGPDVEDDIVAAFNEVESHKDAILENMRQGNVSSDQATPKETPPDDFNIHDEKDPFLRPNIVRGRYQDVDTYLDVQFRLLREDFVRPLREGIAEFLDMRRRGLDQSRLQDIRVYHDVHVAYPTYSNNGIVYRIQFDSSRLKGVPWGASKRLIYGSLVCLSNDEFGTMHFAMVVNRDPKELEQGWLDVRFEDKTLDVLGISPTVTFIMVETSAYFEAYRHVLKGLQEVRKYSMPFIKYIVDCDCANGVDPPAYLRGRGRFGDVTYDLSVVVEKLNSRRHLQVREVPILQDDLWPSAEDLGFDESQYSAFKLGLTKEFAVIQGPPGTGKTHIGLKIIQVLLRNTSAWRGLPPIGGFSLLRRWTRPILVVCYTNHALDQFLEGIAESYPEGIVRVGGRSKSEKLERFKLKNIRHRKREERSVPRYIHQGVSDGTRDIKLLQEQMDRHVDRLKATQRGLLPETTLMRVMDQYHKESLMEGWFEENKDSRRTSGKKGGSAVVDWLGLGGHVLPELHDQADDCDKKKRLDFMEDTEEQRRLLDDDDEVLYGRGDKGMQKKKAVFTDLALDLENMQIEEHPAEDKEGWQVKVNKKRIRNMLKHQLSKTEMMTHEEARQVRDVWTLQQRDRWRLYRYWVARYCESHKRCISENATEYEDVARRLGEFRDEGDRRIMEEACVIGMTTTGAAKYRSILQDIQPAIIIVEEAAEVLESHIVTTLSQQCQHLILIGDHQQLRPNPTVYQLAKKYNMDISLFERMVNNDIECVRLKLQHRMRPEFARLLTPHIYKSLDNHESVLHYENIKGVSSNLFFVDHSHLEVQDKEMRSRSNMHEAQFLASFCRYLLQQGYSPSQITILTTYTGQLFNFKDVMPRKVFEGVRVCTVDNFQGEESDIILLSLVRSNEENTVGFLKVENRVCVALSRAKKGFYAIGNLTMLAKSSKLWTKIIQELREQGSVGTNLKLSCQNHPDSEILATTDDDFKKAPEGGCMRPCGIRLPCGHVCERRCHPTDPEHEEYKCLKPCIKDLCDLGHKCPKLCYQVCGDCEVLVEKTIPRCQHKHMMPCYQRLSEFRCKEPCAKVVCDLGHKCPLLCFEYCHGSKCEVLVEKTIPRCQHKQMMPCYKVPSSFQCQMPCERKLSCGHICKKKCGQTCTCTEILIYHLSCGHAVPVVCRATEDDLVCRAECCQLLQCGHLCAGTCESCDEGRMHEPCRKPCNRVLTCSHQCSGQCAEKCPPCQKRCENRCIHGRCPNLCGEPCVPCRKRCEWRCRHHRCSKPCGEPCDRPRCDQPCPKKRPCRVCRKYHQCIGMCGEPCPDKCYVCDREELEEIVFGTEEEEDSFDLKSLFGTADEPDAKFVQLKDCGHVLEVSGMDQWMEQGTDENIKTCPKCNTPIRHNLRYGNIIKKTLAPAIIDERVEKKGSSEVDQEARTILAVTTQRLVREFEVDADLDSYFPETSAHISQQIAKCRPLSMEQVTMYENKFLFLKRLAKIEKGTRRELSDLGNRSHVREMDAKIATMEKWLFRRTGHVNELEWKKVGRKMTRLNFLLKLRVLQGQIRKKGISLDDVAMKSFLSAEQTLTSDDAFDETAEELVKQAIEKVKQLTPGLTGAVLGISGEERVHVVQAMGLTQGHWVMCSNGHVLSVGDYGGDTVEYISGNGSVSGSSVTGEVQGDTLSPSQQAVTVLVIADNNIGTMTKADATAISKLPCGRDCRLWLVNCNITTIEAGAFAKLPQVTALVIWQSNLQALRSGTFEGMEGLKKLLLLGNNITCLEAGAFDGLPLLRSLYLVDNQILTMAPGMLRGLQLDWLDMSLQKRCPASSLVESPPVQVNVSALPCPEPFVEFVNAEQNHESKVYKAVGNVYWEDLPHMSWTFANGKTYDSESGWLIVLASLAAVLMILTRVAWEYTTRVKWAAGLEINSAAEQALAHREGVARLPSGSSAIVPYAVVHDTAGANSGDPDEQIAPYAITYDVEDDEITPYAEGHLRDHDSLCESDASDSSEVVPYGVSKLCDKYVSGDRTEPRDSTSGAYGSDNAASGVPVSKMHGKDEPKETTLDDSVSGRVLIDQGSPSPLPNSDRSEATCPTASSFGNGYKCEK
ncbi:LOW QUALITY PROTEIN: NFX1-type zinc finger-containing protein 1-like [Branchiostoma floridae x Branchiostoma japonicum]